MIEAPGMCRMPRFTRRAALAALGASAVMGIGYALRGILGSPVLRIRLTDGGMMGASPADMSLYMDMFHRHTEITRTVEEIPGGVRTTTQSNAPDLAAKLHAHVSSMYSHLDLGPEVMCMSPEQHHADAHSGPSPPAQVVVVPEHHLCCLQSDSPKAIHSPLVWLVTNASSGAGGHTREGPSTLDPAVAVVGGLETYFPGVSGASPYP
jgi:hypothetical protein